MDISLFYITAKDKNEALSIGRVLVEERIAACCNVIETMHSVYHWEGKICEDTEAILLVKTRKENSEVLIERVKKLHSYSCLCIVEIPLSSGNPDYFSWIMRETLRPAT